MSCFMFDLLKRYVKDDLAPAESKRMEQHVEACPQCQRQLMEWVESMQEEDFFAIPEAPVPDTFTDEVMDKLSDSVPPRSARKYSSRTRRQRGWDIVKKTALVVAGITALVVTGTVVSPTFANYVNSLFQIENDEDSGMKNAVNNGLVQKLEQKVTDQGITFEAKELMVDSMRIAVIYDIYDESGKQIDGEDHFMKAKLIDSTGKDWLEKVRSAPGKRKHGQFYITELLLNAIFESAEATPDRLTLQLEPTELTEKEGNWSLEIPIDMKRAKESTKTVILKDGAFQSPLGIGIEVKKVEFSPSATRVMLDTTIPESAYVEIERTVVQYNPNHPTGINTTEKRREPAFDDIAYDIINEKGEVIAAWDKRSLHEGLGEEKNVFLMSGTLAKEEGNVIKWWHTFAPIQGEQKLKLQLKKIYEKKQASAKFDLDSTELNKKAAIFKDESGSTFTFSSFVWEPGTGEEPSEAVVAVEGTLGKDVIEANYWSAKDENGNPHQSELDVEYTKVKDGHVHFKGTLVIPRMKQQPKKLSVSFGEYVVEHDMKWEVPIEIK